MIGLITSRFFGDDERITSLGEYYATLEPNNDIRLKNQ